MFVISIWYECDFPLILYWYECDYIFIFIWYECDYLFFLCIGKPLTWSRGVNHGGGAERGKLLQGNRLKRQYCEELQLLPSTTKHRVFRRFSLRIDFFYFEWPAWQDVIREHDDVLKFFYLTEKWNMRPPPAGELLALPSEAWNAVHKEFQKIFKTQRKNDKCSGSSREDRPTRRWKKELLLGGLSVR